MKIGIASFFGYVLEPKYKYELMKNCGFDYVTIMWSDVFKEQDGIKEILVEEAPKAGLTIDSFHAPWDGTNFIWTDSLDSKAVIDNYKNCISACRNHGVPTLIMHLTQSANPPVYSKTGADNIRNLLDFAEKNKVNLALENVRKAEHLERIFNEIKSNRLRLCFDSGHANCFEYPSVFRDYPEKIVTIHLHDNDGTADQHMVPCEGSIDWSEVTDLLNKAKYDGVIMLEVGNSPSKYKDYSEEDFLRAVYDRALDIAGKVKF